MPELDCVAPGVNLVPTKTREFVLGCVQRQDALPPSCRSDTNKKEEMCTVYIPVVYQ